MKLKTYKLFESKKIYDMDVEDIISYITGGLSMDVESLIKQGFNVNYKFPGNVTPLMYASFAGNLENVELLLKYNADPTLIDDEKKDFISVADTTTDYYLDWLQEYNTQKMLFTKYPQLFASFKKHDVLMLDDNIIEEFKYLDNASDLNLI